MLLYISPCLVIICLFNFIAWLAYLVGSLCTSIDCLLLVDLVWTAFVVVYFDFDFCFSVGFV